MFGLRRQGPRHVAAGRGIGGADSSPAGFRPLDEVQPPAATAAAADAPTFQATRSTPDAQLGAAFTPTQPRGFGPLFIGRDDHLRRMIRAVEQEHAHILLFGERGRGKTSLANGFATLAGKAGMVVARRACGTGTTYEALFRGLFAELPGRIVDGARQAASAAELLPEGMFGADVVCDILARLRGARVLLVVDEFDRAEDARLRAEIAETIKNLSDRGAEATLLLVGVASSLDDLLGRQPSVQRALLALRLPPMADADIATLVAAGARAAGLEFEPPAIALITRLSRGMPYYAHLLGLYAARAAAARGSAKLVAREDVVSAAGEAIRKQAAEIEAAWRAAMTVPGGEAALLALALAPFDEDGRVAVAALPAEVLPAIEQLCGAAAGPALARREEQGGARIAFLHPALGHQALLLAASRGALPGGQAAVDSPNGQKDTASIAA